MITDRWPPCTLGREIDWVLGRSEQPVIEVRCVAALIVLSSLARCGRSESSGAAHDGAGPPTAHVEPEARLGGPVSDDRSIEELRDRLQVVLTRLDGLEEKLQRLGTTLDGL